jgi:hypothetical protein
MKEINILYFLSSGFLKTHFHFVSDEIMFHMMSGKNKVIL